MTAVYRWHPYELQAFLCGVATGIVVMTIVALWAIRTSFRKVPRANPREAPKDS